MKMYNHAFTVAFSVETPHDAEHVTANELLDGLAVRFRDLCATVSSEVEEACGPPHDTYTFDTEIRTTYVPHKEKPNEEAAATLALVRKLVEEEEWNADFRQVLVDALGRTS